MINIIRHLLHIYAVRCVQEIDIHDTNNKLQICTKLLVSLESLIPIKQDTVKLTATRNKYF